MLSCREASSQDYEQIPAAQSSQEAKDTTNEKERFSICCVAIAEVKVACGEEEEGNVEDKEEDLSSTQRQWMILC